MPTSDLVKFAVNTVHEAGQIALRYFHSDSLQIKRKRDKSLLSQADVATEQHIVERLQQAYPDHPIIGEETAAQHDPDYYAEALSAASAWVIDPIDGTNNFLAGLSSWCVALAYLEYGEPKLGIVYFPACNDELYFNDSEQLMLRQHGRENKAVLPLEPNKRLFMAHDSFYYRFRLKYPHIPRVTGCTVINVLNVVLGRAFAAITSAHIWDFAAPLAFAKARGIEMVMIESGEVLQKFTPMHLYLDPEEPRKLWRVKGECIVAPHALVEELRGAIVPVKKK